MKTTRSAIAAEIAGKQRIPYRLSADIVADVFQIVAREVRAGHKVTISNFGSFYLAERSPRLARNPKSGESMKLPARFLPVFKPAENFKNGKEGSNE